MRSTLYWGLFFSAMLACGDPVAPNPGDTGGSLTNSGRQTNGTGIHVGSTQPESWIGLTSTNLSWFMDGFTQRADGTYAARGWYSVDVALLSADAPIVRAELGLLSGTVHSIRTNGTALTIEVRNSLGIVVPLQGAGLNGLTLTLQVPSVLGVSALLAGPYQVRFAASVPIDSQFGDVSGHRLEYRSAGLLASAWMPYCKGANNEAQHTVFYQGSLWHPANGDRVDGAQHVTATCESGSVARCMRWGYRPWAAATGAGGNVSLADHHQACIHMKRAAYCGDRRTHTIDGTQLYIQDQLSPALHSGSLESIEAVWSPTGAVCLSNRRRPELPFLGCEPALPTCTAAHQSSYLLATGLVPSGSTLGLLD